MFDYIIVGIIGYLIGSIPFGFLLTKYAGYGDIRSIGSGNIGATNVLRTGNKRLALLTLLLDGGKGAAAVYLAQLAMTYDASLYAAVGAFLGHLFPVWLKFKGGKGVATTIGIFLALLPQLGFTVILIWLSVALIFRMSSLAALVAVGLSPAIAWYLTKDYTSTVVSPDGSTIWYVNSHVDFLPYICAFMAVLVFYKHKENILRLLKGQEPKIGKKNDPAKTTG
ncbi:MAG TPA: glycerol-3-phosphate 1-O-acyltransferase PlsY [Alphaproteobacteria bacterium]|jgi:acyl phosphate:glycerol-3-phosphate acyltransferase|nr:glycerol-3-phosphate 1-O-acyltransferase PlsY [Micavibrio sp.]HQX27414.1 glycerol-3-phosphate 1-O-acyltransferase PlsY [Alphaproteobacteria bacterium]